MVVVCIDLRGNIYFSHIDVPSQSSIVDLSNLESAIRSSILRHTIIPRVSNLTRAKTIRITEMNL